MRKQPGDDSIAVFNGALEVSRITVEANQMLDLVELKILASDGTLAGAYFVDRVECAQLAAALGGAALWVRRRT